MLPPAARPTGPVSLVLRVGIAECFLRDLVADFVTEYAAGLIPNLVLALQREDDLRGGLSGQRSVQGCSGRTRIREHIA